jgi:hypothetical protein
MHMLWILFWSLIALMGFVWFASRISQPRAHQPFEMMSSTLPSWVRIQLSPQRFSKHKRPMRRISLEQFKNLLDQGPDDFLVLDLRINAEWVPFPVADALVLPVRLCA